MKKIITALGIIGVISLTIGSIVKFSHWPGGILIIGISAILLVFYLSMYLIERTKDIKDNFSKIYILIFGMNGILMVIGLPLELSRFSGTIFVFISFFICFIGLLIISLIRVLREKNIELKYAYLNNFIFILGGGIILLYPSILWLMDRI